MADTLLARLSASIMPSTIRDIASHLGESDRAVSRGLELSTAAVLGGLIRKAGDSELLRQVVDLANKTGPNAMVSGTNANQGTNQEPPLISGSKRLLSSLFGENQDAVVDWIARESGLRTASAPAVLALGAQSVLSYFGTRVHEESMTPTMLDRLLQTERASVRSALSVGFDEAFTARSGGRGKGAVIAQTIDSDPVVAQAVIKQRSRLPWLLPLAAVVVGALWLSRSSRETVIEVPIPPPPPVTGTSGSVVPAPTATLGNFVPRTLPDGTTLSIPERGVEGRLLAFIDNPGRPTDSTTWFDFDRLLFDTGSATLRPESQEQLQNVAAILKAHPSVRLKIGGYTDNVGSVEENMKLSRDRANNVMDQLVLMGVAPNVLIAEGYGQEHPVADNSTEEGRALNRRISMLVVQK